MTEEQDDRAFSIVAFAVLTGGVGGIAAYVRMHPFPFPTLIELILSLGFGTAVGFACAPVALLLFWRRDWLPARAPLLWSTILVVVGLATVFHRFGPSFHVFLLMAISAGVFCFGCLLTWALTPRIWSDPSQCRRCGYDLRGSREAGRCPECGTVFRAILESDLQPNVIVSTLPRRLWKRALRRPFLPVLALLALNVGWVGYRESQRGLLEIEIRNGMLESATSGSSFELRSATDFDWDRVCVFGQYSASFNINRVLGFQWDEATYVSRFMDSENNILLVFARGQRVVRWVMMTSGRGLLSEKLYDSAIPRGRAVFKCRKSNGGSVCELADPAEGP